MRKKQTLGEQIQPIWEQNRQKECEEQEKAKDVLEYVVITKGPEYHKAESLEAAKTLAEEINGKVWAAIMEDGIYTIIGIIE